MNIDIKLDDAASALLSDEKLRARLMSAMESWIERWVAAETPRTTRVATCSVADVKAG